MEKLFLMPGTMPSTGENMFIIINIQVNSGPWKMLVSFSKYNFQVHFSYWYKQHWLLCECLELCTVESHSWFITIGLVLSGNNPDNKVHGANMGPIWGRQDPGGPHVGPMNFAIWEAIKWPNVDMNLWCHVACLLHGELPKYDPKAIL